MKNRNIQKTIVEINGISVSFYNTHFAWQTDCLNSHFKTAADIMKNDPNPIIIVGDMNVVSKELYEKYYKSLGFVIAAYDNGTNNHWNSPSYCDTIYVNGKGHIDVKNGSYVQTFGVYSDHNMSVAQLDIY